MMVDVKLTEAGKKYMAENYPQGVLFEYDPEGVFGLHAIAAKFVALIDQMGIPYRFPHEIEGETTWSRTAIWWICIIHPL